MTTQRVTWVSTILGVVAVTLGALFLQEHHPQLVNPAGKYTGVYCAVDQSFNPPKCLKKINCTCPPGSVP